MENDNKDKLLDIKDLTVSFNGEQGKIVALHNISLSLNRGKTIGVVGESGSGKSVTALSILQLLPKGIANIECGCVLYYENGSSVDLLQYSETEIRSIRGNKIAMIFQEPMTSLNPAYTCGNQIVEAIQAHKTLSYKEAYNKVISLFNEVKLSNPAKIFKSYPHELSGGQKQRVMIAMALSCNPDIIIADEPTTALDVTVQKSIILLLKEIQQKYNTGIIFISHDLGLISEIADEVMVLYLGRVVEKNTVNEIFTNPQHPYTRGLIACRPSKHQGKGVLPTVSDFLTDNIPTNIDLVNAKSKDIKENQILLEVSNLKTYFATKHNLFGKITKNYKAVDDVSFTVFKGETLGLVGESGCGKTTLGRSILRLIEPTEGSVVFNGIDIRKSSKNELRKLRKDIQIIFQDPYSSLNSRITIGDAIIEPIKVHKIGKNYKERKEKALYLLQKVGLLPEYFDRYPHEFSGGQRQRIVIARTLALEPKFIICDESVSALDVSVQAQVLNLLNQLKQEFGLTYIFISHDLSVVKYMSDRLIVMKNGKIVEMGNSLEIYKNPSNEYTKELINSIPIEKFNN